MKTKLQDFRMDIKIPLFALFTKYAYKVLVHHNRYLIVQQQWFRHRISQITRFPEERIIVAPPHFESLVIPQNNDIVIEDKDLRIDTYRSSGAGGQHINKT